MKHHFIGLVAMLLACSAVTSYAAEASLQQIQAQQAELKRQLDSGELKQVPPGRAKEIRKAQAEIAELTRDARRLDDLDINRKTRLENALERIEAALKGDRLAQDSRERCWRERSTGSKLMVTRCGTVQEIEQAREGARGYMERPRTCAASLTASCGQ